MDAIRNYVRVLADITPVDRAILQTFDEPFALAIEVHATPFGALKYLAPVSQRGAPIVDKKDVALALLIDCGIRPSDIRIAIILIVPVRNQHHHDLQPVQFRLSHKWISVPVPSDVVQV